LLKQNNRPNLCVYVRIQVNSLSQYVLKGKIKWWYVLYLQFSWYFSSVGADKFSMKIFWELYNTFEHPVGFKFCNFVVHTGACSHKIFNILNFPKILFQFSPSSNGSKVCQSPRTGSSLLVLRKFSQKLENGTIFPVKRLKFFYYGRKQSFVVSVYK